MFFFPVCLCLVALLVDTVFAGSISACWSSLVKAESFCWLFLTTVLALYDCHRLVARLLLSIPLGSGALLTVRSYSKLAPGFLVEIGKEFPFLATVTLLAIWTAWFADGPIIDEL